MRNVLLIAGPVTDPHRFLSELGCHPDVAALPPVTLSNALHAVARRSMHTVSQTYGTADCQVTRAREEGGAALSSYFTALRRSTGRRAIVLHDPSGPMFPFLNPPDLDLLILTRNPESAAVEVGAGAISRVVDAASKALEAFEARVSGFGIGAERIHAVDEEDLRRDPRAWWPRICRMIGVDDDSQAIDAMVRPSVAAWSLRGGRF